MSLKFDDHLDETKSPMNTLRDIELLLFHHNLRETYNIMDTPDSQAMR